MEAAMKLSLAIALFFAATFDVQAAPQAKLKRAEANKIAQMVTVSGECTRLVQAGLAVEGCKNLLVNMNYSTGVSSYWFMTESTILSLSGDGSRRIEQGTDIVVQAIEKVIMAATMGAPDDKEGKEDTAVGFCRFGDPNLKGSTIECVAHTEIGRYEGAFATDGSPPKLEAFQIAQ
jgi:LytS/YehU family sensor histidine kinase